MKKVTLHGMNLTIVLFAGENYNASLSSGKNTTGAGRRRRIAATVKRPYAIPSHEVERMAESKSRYGIIDELTDRKNGLLDEITDLENQLAAFPLTKQRWIENHELEAERTQRHIDMLKEQIKNVDEAITVLKDISRESKKE